MAAVAAAAQNRSASVTLQNSALLEPLTSLHMGPSISSFRSTEDLTRFSAESLHSFSFKNQLDDSAYTRQNVLKRSADLLRDRSIWATGNPHSVNAQARLSGDTEMQGVVELLNQTNSLGTDGRQSRGARFTLGPKTGPADFSGDDNVFEKDFVAQSESPLNIIPQSIRMSSTLANAGVGAGLEPIVTHTSTSSSASKPSRLQLKRTLTDLTPLALQSRLTDALAQPYLSNGDSSLSPPLLTPADMLSPNVLNSAFPHSAPHAHGRGGPMSQAIFTTEAEAPWTITAANDLACLIFGVTKAELRKIGILDVVRQDKRRWLEERLRGPQGIVVPKRPASSPRDRVGPNNTTLSVGSGLTAKLLSKPPSRESGQGRRIVSDDRTKSSANTRFNSLPVSPSAHQPRNVLLCGDVLPILKRNGDVGSATLWVQEKRSNLIWVMEEIAEDIAYLDVDEVGCVTKVSGQSEAVWGMERVRRGMDIIRLIPDIPRLKGTHTGALDYERIAQVRRYTARTANDISTPVTVDRISGESTFRVSSFPYIAGMLVLDATTLKVTSCNTAVSAALFGRITSGLVITEILPGLNKMLDILVEEDKVHLVEGMVIPEQSFRRARAILALRDGKADAAAVFLRPNGIPARHRDGAEIMVDVQMRIVRSDTYAKLGSSTIQERKESSDEGALGEIVYALWVSYSRTLHAANHGHGPVQLPMSRPGTPPQQPRPAQVPTATLPDESDSEDSKTGRHASSISQVSSQSSQNEISPKPPTVPAPTSDVPHKKAISDFTILEEMGAGAYGQVKLARYRTPYPPDPSLAGRKVVIKYVTKRRILVDTWTRDRRLGTVPLEIHVLDYLRRDGFKHPNIVEMSAFFEDDVNYYIEMVPHGLPGMDLFDYIELRTNMEEPECRKIFIQIASAVEFLHTKAKVVHRDIKDENVILDGEGNIKLIDFGSAAYIKNGPFDVFVGTIGNIPPHSPRIEYMANGSLT